MGIFSKKSKVQKQIKKAPEQESIDKLTVKTHFFHKYDGNKNMYVLASKGELVKVYDSEKDKIYLTSISYIEQSSYILNDKFKEIALEEIYPDVAYLYQEKQKRSELQKIREQNRGKLQHQDLER